MAPDNRKGVFVPGPRASSLAQRELTIAELAKFLDVRREKLYAFIKDGGSDPLPVSRVGRSWRINLYEFQDWMCRRLDNLAQGDHEAKRHKR